MANRKHTLGANFKLAGIRETTAYGVKGSAASPGADNLFPPDWVESMTKENIYKEKGQIGLNGGRHAGLKIGETVAGALTGSLYFNSDPIWMAIATCMGEEAVSGYGAIYAHDMKFGENFYNSDNANGGDLERHMTLSLDAGIDYSGGSDNLVFQMQSFKGSSVEFSIERDTGMMCTINGTAYNASRQDVDTSGWTDTQSDVNELVLTGNHCTMTTYIKDYASDTTFAAGDAIRPQNVTITFDQANDALADTGSALGVAEPVFTPTGRKITVAWTQDWGNDDADYGNRDLTTQFNDSTPIGFYMTIVSTGDDELRFRFPRMLLDGPGKPVLDGSDVIGMAYTATAYTPEETLTNTMAGLDNYAGDLKVINDRTETYLSAIV